MIPGIPIIRSSIRYRTISTHFNRRSYTCYNIALGHFQPLLKSALKLMKIIYAANFKTSLFLYKINSYMFKVCQKQQQQQHQHITEQNIEEFAFTCKVVCKPLCARYSSCKSFKLGQPETCCAGCCCLCVYIN